MKKLMVLIGAFGLLPACSLDLVGGAGTTISTSHSDASVEAGFETSFERESRLGTIGDGQFSIGDGKLF